jgi:hypothetical protein
VRATGTLDPDTERLIRNIMRERGVSFKQALNDAIRAGFAPTKRNGARGCRRHRGRGAESQALAPQVITLNVMHRSTRARSLGWTLHSPERKQLVSRGRFCLRSCLPPVLERRRRSTPDFELLGEGIHWPDLDEDLSVAGLLCGPARGNNRTHRDTGSGTRTFMTPYRDTAPAVPAEVGSLPFRA